MNVIDFSRLGFYQMLVVNAPQEVPIWYRHKKIIEYGMTEFDTLPWKEEESIQISWPHYWAMKQMEVTAPTRLKLSSEGD